MFSLITVAMLISQTPLATAPGPGDLSGHWHYGSSHAWHKGPCPAPHKLAGKLSIVRKGSHFSLRFETGGHCNPAAVCRLSGTIRGKTWKATNRVKVDNEGGVVETTVTLRSMGRNKAGGTYEARYTHPGGMRCSWGFRLSLSR